MVEFIHAREEFVGWGGNAGFVGSKDGDTVTFSINGDYLADGHSFVALANGIGIHHDGTAIGKFDGTRFVGSFTGTLLLRTWAGWNLLAECGAPDQRIELVRR